MANNPYLVAAGVLDDLPELMRDWREEHGLTLREAARQADISPSTWCRIEKLDINSNIPVFVKILRGIARHGR